MVCAYGVLCSKYKEMNDNDLSNIAYKNILEGRKNFSVLVLLILIGFLFLGYIGYNQLFNDSWWFMPLLLILSLFLKLFSRVLIEALEKAGISHCPRCSGLLEKNQLLGNPILKQCKHCGLMIGRANRR